MKMQGKTFIGCYSQNIIKPYSQKRLFLNQLNSLKRIVKESEGLKVGRSEALLELIF